VVERILGKAEVVSSILTGSTTFRVTKSMRHGHLGDKALGTKPMPQWVDSTLLDDAHSVVRRIPLESRRFAA
jgi:hypothetical protein